jgi:phenylacetate-coenzyme A ligase PaaK-like adenylate-forming protein
MTTGTATGIEALRERASALFAELLEEHVPRLRWDAARIAEHQRDRLQVLLAHALERSPFHARRLAGVDPDHFELSDLARLPVMTKAEMMESFDDVLTDRRLTRQDVEEQLAACIPGEPSMLLDEYLCHASGGSSGFRGIFVQTLAEFLEFGASIMRPGVARAIAAGGPPPEGIVFAMVCAASPVHSTGVAAGLCRSAPVHIHPVPATLPLPEIVERLNALQPPMVLGYASMMGLLAQEQRAGRLRIAPKALSATSEALMPEDRDAIGAAFGVPVVNQFASGEGLVGASAPGESALTFASDMSIVELVDEDNRPVELGQPSAKALVTNLHNFTQPLIRYELTDRFVRHPDASEHGHLRAVVEGRSDDLFRYGDVLLHPHVIRSVMVREASVREYQVRQVERGVEVDAVVAGELDQRELERALRKAIAAAGLDEAHVQVRTVDAVPRHPETGKTRRFIPL